MAARIHQGGDRQMQGSLSAGRANRADTAVQRRKTLLQHGNRWIGNPRIDVARPLQIEQQKADSRKGGIPRPS